MVNPVARSGPTFATWSDEGVEKPAWFVVEDHGSYTKTFWFSNLEAAQRAVDGGDRAPDGGATVEGLRRQIAELLPFLIADVRSGLAIGPAPEGHLPDGCDDCRWYEESLRWKERLNSGEFGELSEPL